jgi:hypothetical protein
MVTNWFIAAGVVTVLGIVGRLIYRYSAAGDDIVPPWEVYYRALNDAEFARAQFLRNGFLTARKSLKDRICYQVRKCHLRFCPLCC